MRPWALFLVTTLLVLVVCGRKDVNRRGEIKLRGERKISLEGKSTGDFLQKGTASWYGGKFHGRQTANGETYNMWQMTAAHKTLPFDTVLRVVDQRTKREIYVRVNDRGPFIRGRIIDLSRGAARALGIENQGTASVRLYLARDQVRSETDFSRPPTKDPSALRPPKTPSGSKGFWTVQVGSFQNKRGAESMVQQMQAYTSNVFIERVAQMHRVRAGRFDSKRDAALFASQLAGDDIDCWIVFVE